MDPGHNCIVAQESDPSQLKTLSFILGLILAKQPSLKQTLIVCRNPSDLQFDLDFLAQAGAEPHFCYM